MASMGILLDIPKDDLKKITDFLIKADQSDIEENWKPDSLIFFLIGDTHKVRKGNKASELLYQITQMPKDQASWAIKDYLEQWYGLHKTSPWHNTHIRDTGYSGYWAWEVAAVVKVMGLDDSNFKDNFYYPVL